MRLQAGFVIFVVINFLFSSSALAENNYEFSITDASGMPLEDVVIEPVGEAPASADNAVAVMDQVNKRFKPQQLVITQGQLVEFPNSDNIRHHVYSFSKAKTFELKLYADIPENPVNFDEHGVVVLGCNIHDTMIGYIYVSNSDDTVTTNKNGVATLTTASPVSEIHIWYKNQASGPENIKTLVIDDLTRNSKGQRVVQVNTVTPAPTNSFEDTFGGFSEAD